MMGKVKRGLLWGLGVFVEKKVVMRTWDLLEPIPSGLRPPLPSSADPNTHLWVVQGQRKTKTDMREICGGTNVKKEDSSVRSYMLASRVVGVTAWADISSNT